jgi:hypothetical protein
VPPDRKIIAHLANGGPNGAGWKTTIILVNTENQLAQFTLQFWDENGNPLGACPRNVLSYG